MFWDNVISDDDANFHAILNKSRFDPGNAPADSNGKAIGIIMQEEVDNAVGMFDLLVNAVTVIETYVPGGVVAYDEFGQYISNSATLTYAAPEETLKSLMAGIMQKEGILMSINGTTKEN